MLFTRLFNSQHLPLLTATASFQQNQISTFDVSFLYKDLSVATENLPYTDISLIYKDRTVLSGIVDDVSIKPTANGELEVQVRCLDEFGRLGIVKANSRAYYDNEELLFILDNLLSITSGWELGDVSTMSDALIKTTVDLRSKETLWAQMVGAIELIPNTFLRYGGRNPVNGRHRIDVGAFGELADFELIQGDTLLDLQVTFSPRRLINHIEAYGGDAGNTGQRISLQHALNYDPSLATHPDYPIQSDVNGNKVVLNNNVPLAASIVREYQKIRLEGAPTAPQIDRAGYALWQAAVRDFEVNSTVREHQATIELDEDRYGAIPELFVSKSVYVHSTSRQSAIDFTTGRTIKDAILYQINGLLQVSGYTIQFDSTGKTITLKLSETAYAVISDDNIQLYDALDKPSVPAGTATAITSLGITTTSVTEGPGAFVDNYFFNQDPQIYDGKNFVFALPAVPFGTVRLAYAIVSQELGIQYKIVSTPALPATGLTLVVVDATMEWTALSDATISVIWIFS